MRPIVICGLTGSAVYLFTLCEKRHDFRGKKVLENKECVLIFSTTFSDTFLILTRLEQNIITM